MSTSDNSDGLRMYGDQPTPFEADCDTDSGEEIDCWNCEDTGWYVTVGGIKMPCPDCKLGDVNFYHSAMQAFGPVHVDEEIDFDHLFTLPGYDPDDFTEDK